jgi:hypothetical protein
VKDLAEATLAGRVTAVSEPDRLSAVSASGQCNPGQARLRCGLNRRA